MQFYLSVVFINNEVLYLLVGTRFLSPKLVTREGQDPEFRILLCQLHQLAVVDISLPSSGGHIDNYKDVAFILVKAYSLALNICNFELMD